jgi:hypothetical protein
LRGLGPARRSSMFANLIAVGLLQNVHMRRYA